MPDPVPMSRRRFLASAAAAAAAAQFCGQLGATESTPGAAMSSGAIGGEPIRLRWLEGAVPAIRPGTTFGVPWPRSAVANKDATFTLKSESSESLPAQSWPLATWPDGSLKWTAHAIAAGAGDAKSLQLAPGAPAVPEKAVTVKESDDAIEIDTGVIVCKVPRRGSGLIQSISRDGKPIAANAQLLALRQDAPTIQSGENVRREQFLGSIDHVTVEQPGPVRAVVKIQGTHRSPQRAWLPFIVRLYFYSGSDGVRVMHTFIFDGEPDKDFVAGLGVRFDVPLHDPLHDRHVRFAGENGGLWAEGVRNLSGLRRDPGRAIVERHLAGQSCGSLEQFPPAVRDRLQYVPAWNDYSLFQSSADSFAIRKRTASHDVCWVNAAVGHRAPGSGYIGGPSGGVAFGLRDFWQRFPTQLDIRDATTGTGQVTMWMWSPDAQPMDLRAYHTGMGQDTFAKQLDGLEITYEDYEPGFANAIGIARTSEMMLWALPATPTGQRMVELAACVQTPPVLVARPEDYQRAGVFGPHWSLPDRTSAAKKKIEDVLDWFFDYYQGQREQRRWYGFWDYGDIRHTYDRDRHDWRYDVGGFAWDNSELSPDLWLWYAFLRSGRADIFRFAEAMTRHTGEVDVYHLGRFAKLGTRHGVLHWSDSAKQLRISTAIYRRFYYYLTGDERVGDLMKEQVDADRTFETLDPNRKVRGDNFVPQPFAVSVGLGTDWGALAAAWFTEFERTGDEKIKQKLLNSMRSIGQLPHGFFTAGATYDADTGMFTGHGERMDLSHLAAVFGLPEIAAELIQNFDATEFQRAWLQYCQLYNAGPEAQRRALGQGFRDASLTTAHSRLTAYASWKGNDAELARRAWQEFAADDRRGFGVRRNEMKTTRVEGPAVLRPIDEAAWVSTNDTAQWCLAAMANLALIGAALEDAKP